MKREKIMKEEARVIVFSINKGGTGKTTMSMLFAEILGLKGYKVLAIDMDPQGNLSGFSGRFIPLMKKGRDYRYELNDLYNMALVMDKDDNLSGYEEVNSEIVKEAVITTYNNYDLIPASSRLSVIESRQKFTVAVLNEFIKDLKKEYDFIVIDTPPAVNTLTTSAIFAADDFIIPIQPEASAAMTLINIADFVEMLEEQLEEKITIDRIIVNQYTTANNDSDAICEQIKDYAENMLKTKAAGMYIKNNEPLKKAFEMNMPLYYQLNRLKPEAINQVCVIVDEYLEDHGFKSKPSYKMVDVKTVNKNGEEVTVSKPKAVIYSASYKRLIEEFVTEYVTQNARIPETSDIIRFCNKMELK